MTLVEKVARAIWATREDGFPGLVRQSWEDATQLARDSTMADARAALAVVFDALRDPTPAMIQAAVDRPHTEGLIYAAIWRAMLAEAERETRA